MHQRPSLPQLAVVQADRDQSLAHVEQNLVLIGRNGRSIHSGIRRALGHQRPAVRDPLPARRDPVSSAIGFFLLSRPEEVEDL
jgi:hypothetical protein